MPAHLPQSGNSLDRPPLLGRSLILFFNFLMVILAYYQVKAASRSLLMEFGGTDSFPYVWIGSALVLLGFIGVYNRFVARYSRVTVVMASLFGFAVLLVSFRLALPGSGFATAVMFYILVDIFSVVLVEQFWSLTDTVTRLEEGRKSYWFIGTGGLVGGIAGGAAAGALLRYTPMHTQDLLLTCAGLLVLTALLNIYMWRRGFYRELRAEVRVPVYGEGLRALLGSRYLLLIAGIICLSQLAQPIVEFQFLSAVSETYAGMDARTQYISNFFSIMSIVSVAVNIILTPLIHRKLGSFAGLLVQPLTLAVASVGFMLHSTLLIASIMKISDRGLSYSVNRASKELLYIPLDPVNTYQTKAWIDMLGYRLFKVLGSGLILLVTQWLPLATTASTLSWVTLGICVTWLFVIAMLAAEHRAVTVPAPA